MTDLPERARKFIPGGVSSPARAFGAVGGDPVFADHGEGAYLVDTEGTRYVDFIQGFGSVILGHADPRVAEAVATAAKRGGAVGLSTPDEVRLAELVIDRVPTAERVRFVTSGTEASMTAARIARAVTGRSVIVKFEGCYHGHADAFLAKAGSGVATFAVPMAAGVPDESTDTTRVLPFNDIGQVVNFFELHGSSVAAVFVEPIAANMGTVLPEPGFLASILDGCRKHGALAVFDEVVTGFRIGPGGAQEGFDIRPDLTMLGKVLGGGLPIGAVAGRAELMDQLSPAGDVYQAGTYAAHPHAMAAGVATLEALTPDDYAALEATATRLADGLSAAAKDAGTEACVVRAGTFLTVFFTADVPKNFEDSNASDRDAFARFHRSLRDNSVLIPPSPFEAWFPSLAHGEREIEATIDAASSAFAAAKSGM
jgi:glutamate-1-semialdehyde 2,1-aminomutase